MGILLNGSKTIEAGLLRRFDDGLYIHDPVAKGRKGMHEAIDVAQVHVHYMALGIWLTPSEIVLCKVERVDAVLRSKT